MEGREQFTVQVTKAPRNAIYERLQLPCRCYCPWKDRLTLDLRGAVVPSDGLPYTAASVLGERLGWVSIVGRIAASVLLHHRKRVDITVVISICGGSV